MKMSEKWNNPVQTKHGIVQLLIWFTFSATMLAVALLTAEFPTWGNLVFNVVFGVLVLIFSKAVMFERLKLTTLLTLRLVIALFVFFGWNGQIYTDFVLLLLIINILEATFTDFLKNKQYWNGVSGIFLALGVLGLQGTWANDPANPMYQISGFSIGATIAYMIGYTIWNWIFVTGEFSPSVSLMHVGFLSTPIIGCVIIGAMTNNWAVAFSFWLLMRANTLTFGGIMQIAGKDYWEETLHNDKFSRFIDVTHKTPVQIVCMIICVALMVYVIATRFVVQKGFVWDNPYDNIPAVTNLIAAKFNF